MANYTVDISSIRLSDYHYDLPSERIAQAPLNKRDESKLLIYNQGQITHHQFKNLPENLPEDSLLVFNDTKVIQARLLFRRKTGALIEIFLLNPESPKEVQQAMQTTGSCIWSCIIGRKKKWKPGEILEHQLEINNKPINISAEIVDRENNLVKLSWDDEALALAGLLRVLGELPLPPYIDRKATDLDQEQYQTIYARNDGAVAAPTAGLHFTDQVLSKLTAKGIEKEYVTLHVSAGTFLPVKHDKVVDHEMHSEQMIVTRDNLKKLRANVGKIIPVGTTSMRVVESLYWLGVKLLSTAEIHSSNNHFHIEKHYPYQKQSEALPTSEQALQAIEQFMEKHNLNQWMGETSIFVMPGYEFKLIRGLITNYHMPETTLMLLVAALLGNDWKAVYQSALDSEYRFLSYGDSSLLLP